eukprot:366549-Chlamydomonas_euryale.AAC.3
MLARSLAHSLARPLAHSLACLLSFFLAFLNCSRLHGCTPSRALRAKQIDRLTEAEFGELGRSRPAELKALLAAKEAGDAPGWQAFQAQVGDGCLDLCPVPLPCLVPCALFHDRGGRRAWMAGVPGAGARQLPCEHMGHLPCPGHTCANLPSFGEKRDAAAIATRLVTPRRTHRSTCSSCSGRVSSAKRPSCRQLSARRSGCQHAAPRKRASAPRPLQNPLAAAQQAAAAPRQARVPCASF